MAACALVNASRQMSACRRGGEEGRTGGRQGGRESGGGNKSVL